MVTIQKKTHQIPLAFMLHRAIDKTKMKAAYLNAD